jgi:hypothetical protein
MPKITCNYCGKGGKLKHYIIADDLENPRPYHPKCMEKFKIDCMIEMRQEEAIASAGLSKVGAVSRKQ